jgi:hypothetical protein
MNPATRLLDPEQNTSQSELSRMLEEEILALPEQYRVVVTLRHEILGWWGVPVLAIAGIFLFWISNQVMRALARRRLRRTKGRVA